MSRLANKFAELKTSGRKALIPFITAGDPYPEFTVPAATWLPRCRYYRVGRAIFRSHGRWPQIQRASERALAHHTGCAKC
jgi:tryptophan synthase alpha chain